MEKKHLVLTISQSGVVFLSTEKDEQLDRYGYMSSDIDAMLAHVKRIYEEFLNDNARH